MLGLLSNYRLAKGLREVQDRLDETERTLKRLQNEWDDTYDYLRRTMGRISKRAALVAKDDAEQEQQEPTEEAAEPAVNGQYLTPRQRTLQQQILSRRGAVRRTE